MPPISSARARVAEAGSRKATVLHERQACAGALIKLRMLCKSTLSIVMSTIEPLGSLPFLLSEACPSYPREG